MNQKKTNLYERIYLQIKDLCSATDNPYSRMATINAILHHKMPINFWTGFYMLDGEELVVGPYQGTLACLKLKRNTGVCWSAINLKKSVVVADVSKFPGHISCSPLSKSEIVVPLRDLSGRITGVLDIDSKELGAFDDDDRVSLEKLVVLVYAPL
jgi:GAF domain-containing protein